MSIVCNNCPRHCDCLRSEHTEKNSTTGFCNMGLLPVVARAGKHFWEEPCISGDCGSGAIFFSGCSLKCVFCQNHEISTKNFGKEISVERLKEIMNELINDGVHNINLVNPTHFTWSILKALDEKLPVPVVYNCGGYEDVQTLKSLDGKVDIYIPDIKYSDNSLAKKYSNVNNYFETAQNAVLEMFKQTGPYKFDKNGILQKGVIIRHLIMPGNIENSFGVIDWVSKTFPKGSVLFSLMSQYTPVQELNDFPELCRTLSKKEYNSVEQYLYSSKIEDGFIQDLSSSTSEYIPCFDLTGV